MRNNRRWNDKTKGYKDIPSRKNKVIVTQHVKNIDTLSDAQNAQLQRVMNADERVD